MAKRWYAVLFLLFIAAAGYYLYAKNNPPSKVSPTPVASSTPAAESDDKTAVFEVVSFFYQKYEYCMKNPPAEAEGRVGEYCQNNSGLTTANFAANLEKGGVAQAGANPVVCSQTPPESVSVNPDIQINGSQATASANEKFGPTQVTPKLELLKEDGGWKIDNITCPLPK